MTAEVEFGRRQTVLVTEVTQDGKIFVQLDTPEAYQLVELSERIQATVEANPDCIYPEVGLKCYAFSSADQTWYRAIITNVEGPNVTVYYVDFGNTECVPSDQLNGPTGDHFRSPYQAICTSLSDFIPLQDKWGEKSIGILQEMLLNQEFSAVFQSRKSSAKHPTFPSLLCYNVTLFQEVASTVSISQALVGQGIGHYCICSENIQLDSKAKVFTCFVDSPGKFWVQLSEKLPTLEPLMDKMNNQDTASALSQLPPSGLYPGVACCSFFKEDGLLYRCEIVDVATENDVEVCFIDYGNCEMVEALDLLEILPELTVAPAHALQCCLGGVTPIRRSASRQAWSTECCDKFSELIEGREMEAIFTNELSPEVYDVLLRDCATNSLIGKALAEGGYVELVNPSPSRQSVPELQYLSLDVGQQYKVIVTVVESPDVVWCQRTEYSTDFNHIMSQLSQKQSNLPKLCNPSANQNCCVQYDFDQSWCRGVVQENLTSETANVLFVDYGNTEKVQLSELKELSPDFLTVPAQAISFSMNGIAPSTGVSWQQDAIDKFQELVQDKGFLCKVLGLDDDGFPSVQLLDPIHQNLDIGEELVSLRFAKSLLVTPVHQKAGKWDEIPQPNGSRSHKSSPFQSMNQSPFGSQKGSPFRSNKSGPNTTHAVLRSEEFVENLPVAVRDAIATSSPIPLAYTPLQVGCGQAHYSFVSHVNSLTDFYCQFQSGSTELQDLMSEIETHCGSPEAIKVNHPKMGLPVFAQYSEDECWYRAVITSASSASGKWRVNFVDYGNSEMVPLAKIILMSIKALRLSPQAFKCTLFGLPPNYNSTAAAISMFSDLVLEQNVRCFVKSQVSTRYYSVELTTADKKNVVDMLIQAGHAPPSLTPSRDVSPQKKRVDIPLPQIPTDSYIDVYVSHTESPNRFYVQLTESYTTLEQITGSVNEVYLGLSNREEKLAKPEVGSFCCGLFSEDHLWYRGRIRAVSGSEAQVCFVDFGNSEKLRVSDLKCLRNQFAADPCVAIPCSLGLAPGILNSPGVTGRFMEMVRGRKLVTQFKKPLASYDTFVPVTLYDTSRVGVDVNIAEALGEKSGMEQGRQTGMEQGQQKTSPPLNSPCGCVISLAISPSEFYCQLSANSQELNTLMDNMYSLYGEQSKGSKVTQPSTGTSCVVPYSDGSWYRGEIIAVNGDEVLVFYCDYGNTEEVAISDLRTLETQYSSLPPQALRCSLSGITSDWSDECRMKFIEAVNEQEGRVTFLSETAAGFETRLEVSGKDMSEKLIESKLAKPLLKKGEGKRIPPFKMVPGSTYEAVVTAVNSPLDFYSHVYQTQDSLDALMDEIDRYCGSAFPPPSSHVWKKGDYVLARFTDDEGWYRALITEVLKNGAVVQVRYVDYGNVEVLASSVLRFITPEFCKLPCQAIKCCLEGAQHFTFTKDSSDVFNHLLLNQEFQLQCVSVGDSSTCVNLKRQQDNADLLSFAIQQHIIEPQSVDVTLLPHSDKLQSPGRAAKPAEVKISTVFPDADQDSFHDVFVAHADSPAVFYCQFSLHMADHLELLMNQMQEFYTSRKKPAEVRYSKGTFLAAQFSEDDLWYRVQVCDVKSVGADVCFVDYGNCEIVPTSKLQYLDPEFAKLPAQAIPCSLVGAVPDGGTTWSKEAIQSYLDMVVEQNLVAQVRESAKRGQEFRFGDGKTLKVSLVDSSGDDRVIAEQLVLAGLAEPADTPVPSPTPPKRNTSLKLKANVIPITPGSKHEVYVSHLESPSEFWLQLAGSEAVLATLSERLAASSEWEELDDPQVGDVCCTRYSEDQCWYRSVLQSSSKDGFDVQFLDYGNSEFVTQGVDLKVLKPEFLELQVQALRCSLADCNQEVNWTDESIDSFYNLVMDRPLVAEFLGDQPEGSWVVKLLDGTTDIASEFEATQKKLTGQPPVTQEKSTGQPPAIQEKLAGQPPVTQENLTGQPSRKVEASVKISEMDLRKDELHFVYIVHTVAPTEFYCQLVDQCEHLDSLMAQVADYYDGNEPAASLNVGNYCIAQYSGNNAWYRAKITNVESPDAITVHFVDYGNSERMPSNQILSLQPEFASLSSQSICCSLVPDLSHQFTDEKLEHFFSLDFEQDFQIKITGIQNNRYIVDLYDTAGAPLNGSLASQEHANEGSEEGFTPLQYHTGSNVDVYLSYIISPTSFYCQPLELTGELDAMMSDIANTMSNNPPGRLSSPTAPGQPCLAKFSEDGEWYRAVIDESPSESEALVTFVDYGNSELTTLDNLAPISSELLAVQAQAFHCSVFEGLGAELEWPAEKVQAFQDLLPLEHYTITVVGESEEGQYFVDISSNGVTHNFTQLVQADSHPPPVTIATIPMPSASTFRPISVDETTTKLPVHLVDQTIDTEDVSMVAVKGSKTPTTDGETESDNGGEGEPLIRAPFKLSLAVQEVLEATVVHIRSPSLLFIQRVDCQQELDTLMEEIEQYVSSFPGKQFHESFRPGDFVLAKYSLNEAWYRAEVLEVLPDTSARLSFIDYGNVENIPPEDMTMCPENFLDLPAQAIPCSLAHVPPRDSWPADYSDFIDSLVSGQVLRVTVVLPASQGMQSTITMEHLETGVEVSTQVLTKLQEECEDSGGQQLMSNDISAEIEGEIPFEDRESPVEKLSLPERKCEIGTSHEVFIVLCNSPHSFFCQLPNESDILDSITTQLAQKYSTEGEGETSQYPLGGIPKEGDIVCAQFTIDDSWYRAKVLGIHGNECEVLYVDFGNIEVVPLSSLRGLDRNLFTAPAMSFECFLTGIESPSGDGQFDDSASDQMLDLIEEGNATVKIVSIDTAGLLGVLLSTSEGVDVGTTLIESMVAVKLVQTPQTTPSTATIPSSAEFDMNVTPKANGGEFAITEGETPLLEEVEEPIPVKSVPIPDQPSSVPIPVKSVPIPDQPGSVPIPEKSVPIPDQPSLVPIPVKSVPIPDQPGSIPMKQIIHATSYPELVLRAGNRIPIVVASIGSLDEFVCQMTADTEAVLMLLDDIAAEEYTIGSERLSVTDPKPGLPVCVCFTEDDSWYRGLVTAVGDTPGAVTVQFVDYGNTETLPLSRVKLLEKQFANSLPPQAICCSLPPLTETDVNPTVEPVGEPWELVWPASCSEHFMELTLNNEGFNLEVVEVLDNGSYVVKIIDVSAEREVDVREVVIAKLRSAKPLQLEEEDEEDDFQDALEGEDMEAEGDFDTSLGDQQLPRQPKDDETQEVSIASLEQPSVEPLLVDSVQSLEPPSVSGSDEFETPDVSADEGTQEIHKGTELAAKPTNEMEVKLEVGTLPPPEVMPGAAEDVSGTPPPPEDVSGTLPPPEVMPVTTEDVSGTPPLPEVMPETTEDVSGTLPLPEDLPVTTEDVSGTLSPPEVMPETTEDVSGTPTPPLPEVMPETTEDVSGTPPLPEVMPETTEDVSGTLPLPEVMPETTEDVSGTLSPPEDLPVTTEDVSGTLSPPEVMPETTEDVSGTPPPPEVMPETTEDVSGTPPPPEVMPETTEDVSGTLPPPEDVSGTPPPPEVMPETTEDVSGTLSPPEDLPETTEDVSGTLPPPEDLPETTEDVSGTPPPPEVMPETTEDVSGTLSPPEDLPETTEDVSGTPPPPEDLPETTEDVSGTLPLTEVVDAAHVEDTSRGPEIEGGVELVVEQTNDDQEQLLGTHDNGAEPEGIAGPLEVFETETVPSQEDHKQIGDNDGAEPHETVVEDDKSSYRPEREDAMATDGQDEKSHTSDTQDQIRPPGDVMATDGSQPQGEERSHTSDTQDQIRPPGDVLATDGSQPQGEERSHTSDTQDQIRPPGDVMATDGSQDEERSHTSDTQDQTRLPDDVVATDGSQSQGEERSHISDTQDQIKLPDDVVATDGSQPPGEETSHTSDTQDQTRLPDDVVATDGSQPQGEERSHTSDTQDQIRLPDKASDLGSEQHLSRDDAQNEGSNGLPEMSNHHLESHIEPSFGGVDGID